MKTASETGDRRILVINQYFPPDTAATAAVFQDLVSAIAGRGHRVSVLCGRPSYDPSSAARWRPFSRELRGGVRIERVGSSAMDRRGMPGRIANYLSFFALAALKTLSSPRPDAVISGSDPPFSIWLAILAARGRPVIYSLRDLHPEEAIASGMIKAGAISKIWEKIHREALRRSTLVVCLGEIMAQRVREKGVPPGRVLVIPDGAHPPACEPDPACVAELREDASFLVVHAGNLGGAGAFDALARAASRLDGETELLFVGDGIVAAPLRDAGLRVVPFRPASQVPSVMQAGDMHVISLRKGMEGLSIPSKLYTVLAHGRPVLAVVPEASEIAAIVKRYECGLIADPDDPVDIVAKVQWAREHPEALREMSRKSYLAAQDFERKRLISRFVEAVEAVMGSEGIEERRSQTATGGVR